MDTNGVDLMWVFYAILVFFMQAGFTLVETDSRSKNAGNRHEKFNDFG
jgi:ammonia channel protein AmtB